MPNKFESRISDFRYRILNDLKTEKGFGHLILIIIAILLIIVVGAVALGYLGIVKIPYITPEEAVESVDTSQKRSVPPLAPSSLDPNSNGPGSAAGSGTQNQSSSDYLNPFDESVSYVNPFDSSNPFENL